MLNNIYALSQNLEIKKSAQGFLDFSSKGKFMSCFTNLYQGTYFDVGSNMPLTFR